MSRLSVHGTPVIIPAYNEEFRLSETLRSLPATEITPIVAANGCTDNTVGIAESFGAQVLVSESQGKLPSIQQSLMKLGEKALEPLLILDADTRPVFPHRWRRTFIEVLSRHDCAVAGSGPIIHSGNRVLENTAGTLLGIYKGLEGTYKHKTVKGGPNLGLKVMYRDVLDDILDLPNYWPGEDKALIDTVKHSGGKVYQIMPASTIAASPRSEGRPSVFEIFTQGRRSFRENCVAEYISRGPAGSIPYVSE